LKDNDELSLYQLNDYHLPITLNRPNEDGGGGVALYINKEYNFKIRDELTLNSDESQFLFVEIKKKNIKTLIGVTYKPPKTSIDNYINLINTTLNNLDKSSMNCYIAGDYNIDLLKTDKDENSSNFFNDLLSYSFFPTIVKPTRITDTSATLIDNIYTNAFDKIDKSQSGILYTDISDHLPVFILVYSNINTKSCYKEVTTRVYSKQREENFERDISQSGHVYMKLKILIASTSI